MSDQIFIIEQKTAKNAELWSELLRSHLAVETLQD